MDKLFELLINRKAQLDDLMDKHIAQLNQIAGRRAEIEEMLHAITQTAQLSTVDSTPVATEEETQQIAEGLNRLNNPDKLNRHVAPVPPYAGKTAEVWKAKKKNEAN